MAEASAAFAGLSLVGGAMSAVGQLKAGDAKQKAANFEADTMQAQAANAQTSSLENARIVRKTGERAIGSQQVGFAASGIDTTRGGTPLLVMANSAREVELQAIKTQFQGDITAATLNKQAVLTRYGGKIAKQESQLAAAGSILGGAGRSLLAFK